MNTSDIGFDSQPQMSQSSSVNVKWPFQHEEQKINSGEVVMLKFNSGHERNETTERISDIGAYGNIVDSNSNFIKSQSSSREEPDLYSSDNQYSSHKLQNDTQGIESVSDLSIVSLPSSGMVRLSSELQNGHSNSQRIVLLPAIDPVGSDNQSESDGPVQELELQQDNELQIITETEYSKILEEDESKRRMNVSEELDNFLRYFYYHLFFFAWLAVQNWFFVGVKDHFQYCFLVLLLFYLRFIYQHIRQLNDKDVMLLMGKWLRPRLYLKIIEHSLMALTMIMIPFYLLEEKDYFSGWLLLVPSSISAIINLVIVRYDNSPCNATFQLTIKTVLFLRLAICANIILKTEGQMEWEWSTAFWPYWCSFTIQAVIVIATLVIFLNTVGLFFRHEASKHDVLGSLWGTLMSSGFMLSTLQPVIAIVQIYDFGQNLPQEVLDNADVYIDRQTGTERKWFITENERYSLMMQTRYRHEVPYVIVTYPMIYCFLTIVITSLIRKSITIWFESVLYFDDEELASRNGRVNQPENVEQPNLQELTINSDDDEDGEDFRNRRRHVKIKTYDFKRPQFLKKLTNTYFKKSRSVEKAVILNKELATQKLSFKAHKKNTKSISGSYDFASSFNKKAKIGKFSEDILDEDKMGKNVAYDELQMESFAGYDSMPTDPRGSNSDSIDSKQLVPMKNDVKIPGYDSEDMHNQLNPIKTKKKTHTRYRSFTQKPRYADPDAQMYEKEKQEILFANKEFRDKNSCCICFDELANAVIMNCGHGGICYDCGKSILESELRVCHLCREPLLFILQMDLTYAYMNFISVVSATYVEDSSDEGEERDDQEPVHNHAPSPDPVEIARELTNIQPQAYTQDQFEETKERPATYNQEANLDQRDEIEVDELVSYRAEHPMGDGTDMSREHQITLGQYQDEESQEEEEGESMEFESNSVRRDEKLPFDCTQFYLKQQALHTINQDGPQELILSNRSSDSNNFPQSPQQKGRFLLFQKKSSSKQQSENEEEVKVGSGDQTSSFAEPLEQVEGSDLLSATARGNKHGRLKSQVPFELQKKKRGHVRSKTKQFQVGRSGQSLQGAILNENTVKDAEMRRQLVKQYFARQDMGGVDAHRADRDRNSDQSGSNTGAAQTFQMFKNE